jgi:hypothetical protein
VTKNGRIFCVKEYDVEKNETFQKNFVGFDDRHGVVPENGRKNNEKSFEKGLDKREKVW